MFGHGVLDYLNTYGHSFSLEKEELRNIIFDPYWYKGKVLLRSIPMQLDNDDEKELLIIVKHIGTVSSRFSEGAILPVNITDQNILEIIPNNFGEAYHARCEQIDITHDLSQDGQNDILFYCEWHLYDLSSITHFVFGWSEDGVYRVGQTEPMDWKGENRPYVVEVADVDSDGFDEIVWRELCDNEDNEQCDVGKTFSWQNTVTNSEEPINIPTYSFECDLLLDGLEICLSGLRHAILTHTDPTIPEKITQLLNNLPPDDPKIRPYINQLSYLLGYQYELSGDDERAVSTYLHLIQEYPASPWSWLAWARLEPTD